MSTPAVVGKGTRASKLAPPGSISRLRPPGPIKRARSPDVQSTQGTGDTMKRPKLGPRANTTLNTANKRPGAVTNAAVARRNAASMHPKTMAKSLSGSRISSTPATRPRISSTKENTAPARTGGNGKRPAWDLKGRLEDMEKTMQERNAQALERDSAINEFNERIHNLESQNNQLQGTVIQKERQTKEISNEIDDLQKKLRGKQQELDEVEFVKASMQRRYETLEGELKAAQQENSGLKTTVAQLTSSQAGIKGELDAVKMSLENAVKEGMGKDSVISELHGIIEKHEATINDCNAKLREGEMIRRKLHNSVQELKGNIRVFCRVRPLIKDEKPGKSSSGGPYITFPDLDHKKLEIDRPPDGENTEENARRGSVLSKYNFAFDRVFTPEDTQSMIFREITQLVQSALDGYNVCIFAYGQTGSGKTYTMEGPEDPSDETDGVIPRAVRQIFESAHELKDNGWVYEFEASFLEIYNESIRDLLGPERADVKHEIKLTGNKGTDVHVTHLTTVKVMNENQVHRLLKQAAKNRAVASTLCNERSSRSHSVFTLKLSGFNERSGEVSEGTLNLVDLAGSERLKLSGSAGDRLKETKAINTSLSNLGNVIMALAGKEQHIPYRNSKLTHLLQNSLGGNSKTLMFVNISPSEACFNESINSLRFATKVNSCNIGTAQKIEKRLPSASK